MDMIIIKGLETARELILDPKNWKSTEPSLEDRNNGKHDVLSAVWEVDKTPKIHLAKMNDFVREGMRFVDPIGNLSIGNWNDSHTHDQVIAALDKAIALAWVEFGVEEVQK